MKINIYDEKTGDKIKTIDTKKMYFLTSQLKTPDSERELEGRWKSLYKQKRTGLYYLIHDTLFAKEETYGEVLSKEEALKFFEEFSSSNEKFI